MMRGRAATPLNMAAATAFVLSKHKDAAAVIRSQLAASVADCEAAVVSVASVAAVAAVADCEAAVAVAAVAAVAAVTAVAAVAALSADGVNYQTAG
jgi:hypothetical protein